jgi:hypothetical protein
MRRARAVRALIVLLSRAFGRGVSGMARVWAGRIAVTEHIPASRLMSPVPMLAAGGRGDADSGVASGCAARLDHGSGGDRLVASWTGLGASGAEVPSRGVKREAERTRFARLIDRPGRVLGGPAARAASSGKLSLAWLPLTVADDPEQARLSRLAGAAARSRDRWRPRTPADASEAKVAPLTSRPLARTGVTAKAQASVVRHTATVPGGTASYQPTPQGEQVQDTRS